MTNITIYINTLNTYISSNATTMSTYFKSHHIQSILSQYKSKLSIKQLYNNIYTTCKKRPVTATYTALSLVALLYTLNTDNQYSQQFFQYILPLQNRLFNIKHNERQDLLFSSIYGITTDITVADGNNIGSALHNIHNKNRVQYIGIDNKQYYNIESIKHNSSLIDIPYTIIDLKQVDNQLSYLQSLPNNSQHTIISTFLFSRRSHNDQQTNNIINEIYRVLKPNGRLYFIEYTQNNNSILQSLYNPVYKLFNNYRLNASFLSDLYKQNFSQLYVEQWPNYKKYDSREGIRLITSNDNGNTIDNLKGSKCIVAGIAVKS